MIVFEHAIKQIPDGKKLYLVPFGDLHFNTKDCDKQRFFRLIAWIMKMEADGHIVRTIGLGDYNDPFSTSERAAFRSMKGGEGAHDTTHEMLDNLSAQIVWRLGEVLMPVKHTIIGMVEGHHYMEFFTDDIAPKGSTSTEFLCKQLGVPYLGDLGFGRLQLPHNLFLDMAVYHGKGSPGLTTRKKVGAAFPGAHLVFKGHSHDKIAGCDQGMVWDSNGDGGIDMQKRYYIGTGSFLKGYIPGRKRGSYIEKTVMQPSELGVSVVEVGVEKRGGVWRKDYHVSI